jgi:hypothetical protein
MPGDGNPAGGPGAQIPPFAGDPGDGLGGVEGRSIARVLCGVRAARVVQFSRGLGVAARAQASRPSAPVTLRNRLALNNHGRTPAHATLDIAHTNE